jgi:hypothetical protein
MKITRKTRNVEYYELEGIVVADTGAFRKWLEDNPGFSVLTFDVYDDEQHRPCFRVMTTTREVENASLRVGEPIRRIEPVHTRGNYNQGDQ